MYYSYCILCCADEFPRNYISSTTWHFSTNVENVYLGTVLIGVGRYR
jgi:hypothetical protein